MYGHDKETLQALADRARAIHFEERQITIKSVAAVAELEGEKAWYYLEMSVDQLAAYIGLTPSQYYKRLKAHKVMARFPKSSEMFEKGEVQVSQLNSIASQITEANADVMLEGIKNLSKRETEDFVHRVTPDGRLRDPVDHCEITMRMRVEQRAIFDRVREVAAHHGQVPTLLASLITAAEYYLDEHDPMRRAERAARREAAKENRQKREAELKQEKNKAKEKTSQSKSSEPVAIEIVDYAESNVIDLRPAGTQDESPAVQVDVDLNGDDDAIADIIDSKDELYWISANPPLINEANENYSFEELRRLTPLERAQGIYQAQRNNPRRPIRVAVRNRIWLRDGGQCSFQHANGERCKEKMMLEIDHIRMVCRGGGNEEENLTLRCRYHNQFMAEKLLGAKFMMQKREEQKGRD